MSDKEKGKDENANDYKVGYGKPPKEHQFPKNQSGNLKGRPKGARNFKTDVKETLKIPVRVTNNGQPRTVSTQRAALLRLREKALGGDARALDRLLGLAQTHNGEDLADAAAETLAPSDQAILDNYVERRRRRDQKQPTADQSDPRESEEEGDDHEEEDDDDAWIR